MKEPYRHGWVIWGKMHSNNLTWFICYNRFADVRALLEYWSQMNAVCALKSHWWSTECDVEYRINVDTIVVVVVHLMPSPSFVFAFQLPYSMFMFTICIVLYIIAIEYPYSI
jgi:hypothetical protein